MSNIKSQLNSLPLTPGVYMFKDGLGKILYVGKSARLRPRVRSYFAGGKISYNPAKAKLVKEIENIEVCETSSEIEALVLEAQLIKRLKPPFNVLMRDSKNYAWVAITKEDFPRIFVTHQPTQTKPQDTRNKTQEKIEYIGPFTEVKPLKRTLIVLRSVFPYYTKRSKPSALERQMGIVPGEEITPAEYKKNIRAIKNVITGRAKKVLVELKKSIRASSRAGEFEKARSLRDRYQAFETVMDHAHVLGAEIASAPIFGGEIPKIELLGAPKKTKRIECYDISNIQGQEAVGSMVVFERKDNGTFSPNKNEYRKFKIKTVKGANDTAMIAEVIKRRLTHKEWPMPQLIVVDGGRGQLNAALLALRESRSKNKESGIRIVALAKRLEEVYLPERTTPILASRFGDATKKLLQAIRDETHRFGIAYHRKLHRKGQF